MIEVEFKKTFNLNIEKLSTYLVEEWFGFDDEMEVIRGIAYYLDETQDFVYDNFENSYEELQKIAKLLMVNPTKVIENIKEEEEEW